MAWCGRHPYWSIVLLAGLAFLPGLGGVHLFDWDEINFAEAAREMVLTGEWMQVQIDYQPFYQKPPLFLWLQALAMSMIGVGEYAARLPNALCGLLTLVLLYRFGKRVQGPTFGWLWAGAYFGGVLPFLYFKSGIIDPWFNLFIFLGLYHFILFYWRKEGWTGLELRRSPWTYLFWAGVFVGLGILTKGPVALLLPGLTMGVYWVYRRFRLYVSIPELLFFLVACSLVTLLWIGVETLRNGPEFVREFFTYQWRLLTTPDAGHGGFPGYHFVVALVGCFPASIFAIRAFFRGKEEGEGREQRDFRRWMKFLFWVVLIIFSLVQSKIVHYSSLVYFPLTYLAAQTMADGLRKHFSDTRGLRLGLWLVGALYVLATLALPWIGRNPSLLRPLLARDPFALGNLEATVHWTGWEMLPGLLLLAVLLAGANLLRRARWRPALLTLYLGTAAFTSLTLVFVINRIEGYSQRAAIVFFEQLQGREVYATTHGYKSYAHLFYTRKPPGLNPQSSEREWLLSGPIDRPVFISTKVHKAHELRGREGYTQVGAANGFVFFRRDPVNTE